MRIQCAEEQHHNGGNGSFLCSKAENALASLVEQYRSSVRLIYLDPPFCTGDSFTMRIGRGKQAYKLVLYEDKRTSEAFVEWMREILTACHEMLDASGSLYLHIDYRMTAKMRLLLDEIFGESNFLNEIIWAYKTGGRSTRYYPRKHDTILFYRKSRKVFFDIRQVGIPRGPERRNHMKRFIEEDGRIGFSIRSNGKVYKYYEDSLVFPTDVWSDIEHLQQKDRERTGYATQKPEALLKRIILASSQENDLVMDLFSGSGTTAAVAAKLNRRFVAVDASPVAGIMLRKRLLAQGSALNLMDQQQGGMTFRFGVDRTPCAIDLEVKEKALILKKVSFEGCCAPLAYAAIGTINCETFVPQTTNCSPRLPLQFKFSSQQTPVLQLMDAEGHQAFFTVV